MTSYTYRSYSSSPQFPRPTSLTSLPTVAGLGHCQWHVGKRPKERSRGWVESHPFLIQKSLENQVFLRDMNGYDILIYWDYTWDYRWDMGNQGLA
jgi:hypothetical protein